MCGKIVFLTVACLAVLAVVQAHHGGPGGCGFQKMKECCPSLLALVNETVVKSCMPPRPDGPPSGRQDGPPSGRPDGDDDDKEEGGGRGGKGGGRGMMGGMGKGGKQRGGPGGEGPGGRMHHGMDPRNRSCMMECAFAADGLTTTGTDGKVTVNLVAVNARLRGLATGNWTAVIESAIVNCTTTAPVVEVNQTCTSGSGEVARCLMKYMITNCPNAVNSSECRERIQMMSMMDGRGPMMGKMGGRGPMMGEMNGKESGFKGNLKKSKDNAANRTRKG